MSDMNEIRFAELVDCWERSARSGHGTAVVTVELNERECEMATVELTCRLGWGFTVTPGTVEHGLVTGGGPWKAMTTRWVMICSNPVGPS